MYRGDIKASDIGRQVVLSTVLENGNQLESIGVIVDLSRKFVQVKMSSPAYEGTQWCNPKHLTFYADNYPLNSFGKVVEDADFEKQCYEEYMQGNP